MPAYTSLKNMILKKMKNTNFKYLLLVVLSLFGGVNWAQAQSATSGATESGGGTFEKLFLFAVALVIIVAFIAIWRTLSAVMKNQMMAAGVTTPQTQEKKTNFWAKLTNATPIEHEADIMLDHNYDGIRELDNKLPPWWVALFYITIAWAVVYIAYFHVFHLGPLQAEEYTIKMEQAEAQVSAHLATLGAQVDENTAELKNDEASLKKGKDIFTLKCVACHRADGGGLIGPNLTDKYWLHGSGIKNIFKTVKYGVPSTAMAPWANQLSPSEIEDVASYVISLQGTNPPDPKAPEGKEE